MSSAKLCQCAAHVSIRDVPDKSKPAPLHDLPGQPARGRTDHKKMIRLVSVMPLTPKVGLGWTRVIAQRFA